MTTAKKLLSTQTGGDKLYVDDMFSTYLYTGNGSTQTINNGIDLAGEGGLVWTKARTAGGYNHNLQDTARGAGCYFSTDLTSAQQYIAQGITAFNNNGYSLGNSAVGNSNTVGYASWTFRKAPKFFDVVTYTGNGVAGRQIPHGLGIAPGMIIVKCYSGTNAGVQDWLVYHRSLGNDRYLSLDLTAAQSNSTIATWNSTTPTESIFTLGGAALVNASSHQYVAYLFAHDPSEDGMVQCGSFTTDASGNAVVSLGWEPQYLLIKTSNVTDPWYMYDTMRGLIADDTSTRPKALYPNTSDAESNGHPLAIGASGFRISGQGASITYIYLAIRRSNKPPTDGTKVYNAITRTGTGANATVTGVGFAPDMSITKQQAATIANAVYDRLRGATKIFSTSATTAETADTLGLLSFDQDGVQFGSRGQVNGSGVALINHFFRRAPGFFDVVCYTGTGIARTVPHGLGVAPELMIVKQRAPGTTGWLVYVSPLGNDHYLALNGIAGKTLDSSGVGWNLTSPTSMEFSLGTATGANTGNSTYVAYLFASLPGISKVGIYTGNGTSLSVECGFSTGARFILVKSVDDTGDWFIWDTARGIVAANDPHLSLNTQEAEVTTDDSVDPYAGGFIVNQNTATNINITGKRYIFLAIA